MRNKAFPSRLMLALQPSWAVNPACLLANRMCRRSLSSMTPVNRRASIDSMVIDLQLRTSGTSFPGFGISVVLFSRHIRGKWRVRRAADIILASTVTAPGFLKWALAILSRPTAVLVLILARRRIISSFPMGTRNPPTPMDRGSGRGSALGSIPSGPGVL